MSDAILEAQRSTCARVGSPFVPAADELKCGISADLLSSSWDYPINGLRIPSDPGTTGWFVWSGSGEPSLESDYFQPLHLEHLPDQCAEILPYMGLAPGWRFLLAPGHEDIWFDEHLLLGK